jgi:hypothetical protein
MKVEHIIFLDSVNYLPFFLRKLPEAFGLEASKSWYPHYFNMLQNLDCIGPIPDKSYYGVDAMSKAEREEFLVWNADQMTKTFNNRSVLEPYCQDDVTVLRQAYKILRRNFVEIGNIEVFLDAMTIASSCKKVFLKQFLKPNTIGIIPSGGYTNSSNQRKKAFM